MIKIGRGLGKPKAIQVAWNKKTGKRVLIKHFVDRTEATKIALLQDRMATRITNAKYIVRYDGVVITDNREVELIESVADAVKRIKSWFTPYRVKVSK